MLKQFSGECYISEVRYCQVDHFRVLGAAVCRCPTESPGESTVLEGSTKSTAGRALLARDHAIAILLLQYPATKQSHPLHYSPVTLVLPRGVKKDPRSPFFSGPPPPFTSLNPLYWERFVGTSSSVKLGIAGESREGETLRKPCK